MDEDEKEKAEKEAADLRKGKYALLSDQGIENRYKELSEKALSGKELTDSERAEASELGKILNSKDGKYSYDSLIAKDDLTVVELGETVPTKPDGTLDRAAILAAARKNAREQNNESNTEKETFVYVNDISLDVRVNREGLEHGLSRNAFDTALATMRIGDLLKSSIAVNELNGRTTGNKTTEMSYVLLAVGQNKKSPYLVRMVVDKNTNTISEISTFGLYAIRAKENGDLFMPQGNEGVDKKSVPYLISTISVSQLFDSVKGENLVNEVFSADVAKKLGVERAKGTLSDSLRFSRSAQDSTGFAAQKGYHETGRAKASQTLDEIVSGIVKRDHDPNYDWFHFTQPVLSRKANHKFNEKATGVRQPHLWPFFITQFGR